MIQKKPFIIAGFFYFLFSFSVLCLPAFSEAINSQSMNSPAMGIEEALKVLGIAESRAEFRWDPFFSMGTFSLRGHEAAFISGETRENGAVLLDHKDILTLPLPYMENGKLLFPDTFVVQVKNAFANYVENDRSRFRIAAIIVDPGHGGKDSGASWEYNIRGKILKSVEKDITLKVSKQLHSLLAAAFPDKKIIMTRTGDTNPSKDARVAIANTVPLAKNEAAIYISVHANSSFNRSARGYEVWYLTPSYRRQVIDKSKYTDLELDPKQEVLPILNTMMEEELTTESILLANYILKRMGEAVGDKQPSRGLKAEEWFVVRNARMPSVLVELGFVSNETEALLMNDDAYLKNLSEALYKGIADFVSFFERSGGFTALQ